CASGVTEIATANAKEEWHKTVASSCPSVYSSDWQTAVNGTVNCTTSSSGLGCTAHCTATATPKQPTLSAIRGPGTFCKSSTRTYCVNSIPGINYYKWTAP